MSTYEMILLYVRTRPDKRIENLRRSCLDGTIPVSHRQAQRCVARAVKRGLLTVSRMPDEQGRPLILEAVE